MTPAPLDPTHPTVVDGDDFVAALNDERAKALSRAAVQFAEQLRLQGRDHSVPAGPPRSAQP
jgi:hypothetical protein